MQIEDVHNINNDVVQGHLSENMKIYCMKYFKHEIFAIYGITHVECKIILLSPTCIVFKLLDVSL